MRPTNDPSDGGAPPGGAPPQPPPARPADPPAPGGAPPAGGGAAPPTPAPAPAPTPAPTPAPAPVPVSVAPGAVATVTNPIRPPTADEQSVIDAAEKQRASALSAALAQISAFLGRKPADADGDGSSGAPEFSVDDMKIVDKVQRWLFLPSVNSQFWDCVQKFHDLVTQNQALGTLTHSVDTVSTDHAYVFNTDTSRGVFFSLNVYFKDNSDCQREVIVHEYFHYIVGPDHFYSTTQTDEAMKCPHHLSELVFDLATGCTLGCSKIGVCH